VTNSGAVLQRLPWHKEWRKTTKRKYIERCSRKILWNSCNRQSNKPVYFDWIDKHMELKMLSTGKKVKGKGTVSR